MLVKNIEQLIGLKAIALNEDGSAYLRGTIQGAHCYVECRYGVSPKNCMNVFVQNGSSGKADVDYKRIRLVEEANVPFSAEDWFVEDKVVTRSGKPVEILSINGRGANPIKGYIGDKETLDIWPITGKSTNSSKDLFVVKEKIAENSFSVDWPSIFAVAENAQGSAPEVNIHKENESSHEFTKEKIEAELKRAARYVMCKADANLFMTALTDHSYITDSIRAELANVNVTDKRRLLKAVARIAIRAYDIRSYDA